MSSKYSKPAEKSYSDVSAEKLKISFDYLDWDLPDLFFVHGLVEDHYRKLFDCLAEIGNATEDQIVQQKHSSLTPKSIFNNDKGTKDCFPTKIKASIKVHLASGSAGKLIDAETQAQEVVNKAFEIRLAKAYGRLHGFVWNKTFYVVWFDPAHNLYPLERFGIRSPQKYATVKGFSPDQVQELKEINKSLVDDYAKLLAEHEELMNEYCNGNSSKPVDQTRP